MPSATCHRTKQTGDPWHTADGTNNRRDHRLRALLFDWARAHLDGQIDRMRRRAVAATAGRGVCCSPGRVFSRSLSATRRNIAASPFALLSVAAFRLSVCRHASWVLLPPRSRSLR
jgi:hypothetical protein